MMDNKNIDDRTVLVDKLGREMKDLRISLTDRCNFNCTYCMPDKDMEFLPRSELLSFEEIEYFVRIAAEFGLSKIKLTGGEPTLRVGIEGLIARLKAIPGIKDIGLITNGVFIKNIGHRLKSAGLDRISISLDALDNRVFQNIVGNSNSVHPVLQGIAVAEELGFSPIKINCVVQRGVNDDEIMGLAEYFRKPHFHLRFIEFMDVGNIAWKEEEVVPSQEILEWINAVHALSPVHPDYPGEVASRFRYNDGQGEIGFISSVTNPFCRGCTRVRISSDGKLYSCLFSDRHIDLKQIMRSSDMDEDERRQELKTHISKFWREREDRYSEERKEIYEQDDGRRVKANMNFLGG